MALMNMNIVKERSLKKNHFCIIVCLCLAFLGLSGCSKRDKVISIDSSNPELAVINDSLEDYMFLSHYFENPDRINSFLSELLFLYYKSYQQVGSSNLERTGLSSWLRAGEKSEAVLRELCSNPKFVIEANKWKIEFNVIKQDGSAVRWETEGEYSPENQYNQIDKIEITTLKPKGTFSWPFA